ncbi:MAG: DUF4296 domain-containing protein, partial [Chitinophagaceae bacterium]
MMKQYLYIIGMMSFCWLAACSRQNSIPRSVIGINKMSSILMDMQLAEAFNNTGLADTNRKVNPQHQLKVFYAQILMLHHTDTATFFRSYHFYEQHPDLIKKIYGIMTVNINKKSARLDSLNVIKDKVHSEEQMAQEQMEKIRKLVFRYQFVADSLQQKPFRIFRPENFEKQP